MRPFNYKTGTTMGSHYDLAAYREEMAERKANGVKQESYGSWLVSMDRQRMLFDEMEEARIRNALR